MTIVNKARNFPIIRASLAVVGSMIFFLYAPEFAARLISWQW